MKKILFDITLLLDSHGKETGLCREALEILKVLIKYKEFQIFPLITSRPKIDPSQYLQEKGLSELNKNIVIMPYLKMTCGGYKLMSYLRGKVTSLFIKWFYQNKLKNFDLYFSVFSPISPLVYQSSVKTILLINDLFPIYFPEACDKKFILKYRYWMKQANADELVCISKSTQEDFLKFRPDISKDRTRVVYLAANRIFKPTPNKKIKGKYGIKTSGYFLGVSDHNPRKNFHHLIDSFVQFIQDTKTDNVSLVLVGPKKQFNEIENYVQNLKDLQGKIILTGFVPDMDLPALYSEAELFIYPSLYEGFGLPVLEAMQCGCPVLTTDNTSLPEVGKKAVEYISGKNILQTASKLAKLHANSKKRQQLSLAGLKRAKEFSWEKVVQQIFKKQKGK